MKTQKDAWTVNASGDAVLPALNSWLTPAALWMTGLVFLVSGLVLLGIAAGIIKITELTEIPYWAIVFGLISCIFSLFFLILAFRQNCRYLSLKGVTFLTARLPLSVGGRLQGLIRLQNKISKDEAALIRIYCQRFAEGSSRSSSSSTSSYYATEWEDTRLVPSETINRDRNQATIPFEFIIPYRCSTSYPESKSQKIRWRLQYKDILFELPVVKDEFSDPEISEAAAAAAKLAESPETIALALKNSRIAFKRRGADALLLEVPPVIRRNPGFVLTMTLIFLFPATGAFMLLHNGGDFIPYVFGTILLLGALSMILWILSLIFTGKSIIIDPDGLQIICNHRFFVSSSVFPLQDIQEFNYHLSGSANVNGRESTDYRVAVKLTNAAQRVRENHKSLNKTVKQFDEQEINLIAAIKGKDAAQSLGSVLNTHLEQLRTRQRDTK